MLDLNLDLVLVLVKIFQIQDMLHENRFLDTFNFEVTTYGPIV